MRYALALAVATILGPILAFFGVASVAAMLGEMGGDQMSRQYLPLLLFVAMLYAIPGAIVLMMIDLLVVRFLRGRFSRPLFALAMLAAGLAAGAAFALLLSPGHKLAENMVIFLKMGGTVALLWAVLRPAPKAAEPAHG